MEFTQEITKCFVEQYSNKCKDYNKLSHFQKYKMLGDEIVRIHDDFIFTMSFIIKLITKLNKTQPTKERKR